MQNKYTDEILKTYAKNSPKEPINVESISESAKLNMQIYMIEYMKKNYDFNDAEKVKLAVTNSYNQYKKKLNSMLVEVASKTIDEIATGEIKGWLDKFKEWIRKWFGALISN